METKDNKLGIFIAISKNWPEEQRKKYLEQLREEAKNDNRKGK